jgi:hypothetical protein
LASWAWEMAALVSLFCALFIMVRILRRRSDLR